MAGRPPGTSTVYGTPGPAPSRRAAAIIAAQAPVPQERVSPTPRSNTRSAIWRGPTGATNSTFTPFGYAAAGRQTGASISAPAPATPATNTTAGGLPMATGPESASRPSQA